MGLLTGGHRTLLRGLLLARQGPLAGCMIPHAFILLLEGQGYILGLKEVARLHLHIAFTLTLAALYEVFEVIYIVSRGVG